MPGESLLSKLVSWQLLLPSAFGVLMVGAAAHRADRTGQILAAAALLAVLVAVWSRAAATVAVLLTVLIVVLVDPAPMYTALAGLAATAYLVLRHGGGRTTTPTAFAAVGFAALVTVAVVAPVQTPWLPLAAPLVLLVGYLLTLLPFLAGLRR